VSKFSLTSASTYTTEPTPSAWHLLVCYMTPPYLRAPRLQVWSHQTRIWKPPILVLDHKDRLHWLTYCAVFRSTSRKVTAEYLETGKNGTLPQTSYFAIPNRPTIAHYAHPTFDVYDGVNYGPSKCSVQVADAPNITKGAPSSYACVYRLRCIRTILFLIPVLSFYQIQYT
jgi:hypothetical protein